MNLTVTPTTLPLLFRLLSSPALQIRLATSTAFLKMITKGLKEPTDKLQLIRVLALGEVLTTLEANTRGYAGNDDESGNEEKAAFREGLGKLANGLGGELVKLLEDVDCCLIFGCSFHEADATFFQAALPEEHRQVTQELLDQIFPVALQFLADEWDDTSQTVHPFFTSVLSGVRSFFLYILFPFDYQDSSAHGWNRQYKRQRKASPQTHLTESKRQFLSSFLEVALQKMKWDADADVDFMDEDDKLSFEVMRKVC